MAYAERYVTEKARNVGGWRLRRKDSRNAEVENESGRFQLDMVDKTCTCRKWQLIGLPCEHAAEVIVKGMNNADWHLYCDSCYYLSKLKNAYKKGIGTMSSKDQWVEISMGFEVGPPHAKRPRGRPKKKRIRGKDEQEIQSKKKSKRRHKCTRCGRYGHHKTTCKEPINLSMEDPSQPLPNQDSSTQSNEARDGLNSSTNQLASGSRGRGRGRGKARRGQAGREQEGREGQPENLRGSRRGRPPSRGMPYTACNPPRQAQEGPSSHAGSAGWSSWEETIPSTISSPTGTSIQGTASFQAATHGQGTISGSFLTFTMASDNANSEGQHENGVNATQPLFRQQRKNN